MAEGLNRVMLFGNLGADPEYRTTSSGTGVLKLRLATTERFKDNSGEWKDRTEWHRVTVWGKRGEALSRILSKGSTIFVEGSLRTSSYEKDGEKRYTTEINATNVLLGGRGDSGGHGARSEARAPARADDAPPDAFGYGAQNEEDIPFLADPSGTACPPGGLCRASEHERRTTMRSTSMMTITDTKALDQKRQAEIQAAARFLAPSPIPKRPPCDRVKRRIAGRSR